MADETVKLNKCFEEVKSRFKPTETDELYVASVNETNDQFQDFEWKSEPVDEIKFNVSNDIDQEYKKTATTLI